MRAIDADALNIDFYDEYETEDDAYAYGYVSKHQIDTAPTIEAVSVVRCKECENFIPMTHGCKRSPSVEPWWEDDFCSYGEREGE